MGQDTGRAAGVGVTTSNVTFGSGQTTGKVVQITSTSTPGQTIHTAVAGTVSRDRVRLIATNTSTSAVVVTVEWGGTGTANNIVYSVPAQNTAVIVPQLCINNGLVIGVFAATGSVINCAAEVETLV